MSAAEAWANDGVLKKVILGNLKRKTNNNTALSRNALKTSCLLYGCIYPTSFPISAVMWILKQEANRRPDQKLLRFIDPCAGWGDRLAGAILSGPTVVEEYVGIDPWNVSHQLCHRILAKLGQNIRVSLYVKGAEDQSEAWPDADLVFTSPPYGKKECYNCASGDRNDGQAWRLCDENKFTSYFLEPLMQNAARSTRTRKGRVIINISNNEFEENKLSLMDNVINSGKKAGLVHVKTYGLRSGMRPTNKDATVRGDPFLVFQHP
jgi:hypothetical protein